ncbi:MAG: hydrolase [Nevskia sp.]|nr:hydrolase [Nevskia sp.]
MDVEVLHRGKWLVLKREGQWEYISRTRERGAAFILAVTDAQEIVLVEQYRTAIHAHSIELPAGIIGDEAGLEHEAVEAAALRELEEETGFRGSHAERVLTGPVAAGFASELFYLFRATGLTRVHAGGGVEGENITVHLVPLREVRAWLEARAAEGKLIDARVHSGLWYAMQD